MEFFDSFSPNSYFWLVAGIIFILIEITVVPGIGFLFAGLGAMLLGGLITFDIISLSGWFEHIAYFFFFTTIWAVILWKPLKNFTKNKGTGYRNMVGTIGEVAEELEAGRIGKIKWSGTIMRARISPSSSQEKIKIGETVWVHGNKEGVLEVDVTEPQAFTSEN